MAEAQYQAYKLITIWYDKGFISLGIGLQPGAESMAQHILWATPEQSMA